MNQFKKICVWLLAGLLVFSAAGLSLIHISEPTRPY